MQKFVPLLLDVWREACRHIDLQDAVSRIAEVVSRRLPAELMLVRRIDLEKMAIDTIGVGLVGVDQLPTQVRRSCTADEIEPILAWCRQQRVISCSRAQIRKELQPLIPEGIQGTLLFGPLTTEEGVSEEFGVLMLATSVPGGFSDQHEQILRALLEPLAVAIKNDRQLKELQRLREAVEADRQALLSRLGREDVSDTIVGAETGLRHVMERVELVSPSDAPVLILGETGSGKEVVARAIHTRSHRVGGPFLRVNCGAIAPELVDSELFGHERGSFTGAVSMRKGWFERADGGTLFLDEVAELPLAAQVRLLRVLQDGTFERVGGQRQLNVDVRIVAATHRDLQDMVANNRFREDLWYRIAVFPIRLPPLRERVDDIPTLATHFALRASRRLGSPPLVPSPEDHRLLITYPWPGNARELAAVIERAAILGNGRKLDIATALGAHPHTRSDLSNSTLAQHEPAGSDPPIVTLDAAMARHIETALKRTYGRIEGLHGAARLLGINPCTLRARMRKLEIDWKRFRSNS